jgi:hypothetical protein
MQGFVEVELTFFLGYDQFLVAGAKLGHVLYKNAFLLLCTRTEDDTPDIGVGRKGAHDWCCAGGSVAFLFSGATKAAEVVGGIALVGCLIDCLGFYLFLMTKELCSLLLSPCSNEVSF